MYDRQSHIGRFAQSQTSQGQTSTSNQCVDSFSSSIPSIEGYNHAVVFVDKCTGYIWIYGMKTKDQMINVVRRWYSYIADLRTKHRLVVIVRDNAGENKSQEVKEFV